MMNIVNFLSRDDKHYLGGGNRLLWTPNFPQWLDKPGFWDKAHYYNLEIEPVFTLTFLDEKGNELPLNLKQRRWFPSHIRNLYNRVDGLDIVEEKTLFENDILASSISLTNTGEKQVILDCILWKLHRNSTEKNELTNIESSENGFCITQNIDFRQETEYEVECFLGLNSGVDSRGVYVSNNTSVTPVWKYTPMIEKFNGKLIDGVEGVVNAGERDIVYLGVHSKIILRANEHKNILAFFAASNKREDTKKSVDEVMSIKHP
ncbi:MAG: hypothetical protein GY863_10185, partial [bacterium]|nr:hypothetical protein [bacterium]